MRSLSLLALFTVACANTTHAAETPPPEPKRDLAAPRVDEKKTAVFAMGCFWCSEAVFEQIEGVTDVVSGYAGGTKESAVYETVSNGKTAHAEAIIITYDSRTSYGQLLRVFFATHDATTKDRQGPDWGHQYRTAIFYANDDEKRVAEAYIKQLDDAKYFQAPIATTIEPLGAGFFPAEAYHQDFVKLHPDHPYVRANSIPKLQHLVAKLPGYLRKTVKP